MLMKLENEAHLNPTIIFSLKITKEEVIQILINGIIFVSNKTCKL